MKSKNTSTNKKGIRITALFIMIAFLITVYTPVPSGAASLKEEVVYVRLNNDGSVDQVYVVNSFELGENNTIIDYGNYAYVQNLTDNSEIRLEKGKVTVDAQGNQLYYEGFLMNPQLPWDISIKYILDGKETSSDDIAGKSGSLIIQIETDANPLGNKDFFDSYALQISLTLDSSICKNISAPGGTVATAGRNKQVSYVVLPGKASNIKLSADVKNFEMPAVTIGGVRLNMDFSIENYDLSEIEELTDAVAELDDGVEELLDGIFDMKKGVSDLHSGTKELRDGVGEFKDGVGELSEGIGELKDGVAELKDGTIEMADGAIELADGTIELVDGVRELDEGVGEFADGVDELYDGIKELLLGTSKLYGGMGEITDGSAELKSGAKSLASGAAAAASGGGQLAEGFDEYFKGIIALVNSQLAGSEIPGLPLTRENYSEVLENALYGQAIALARDAISKQVYGAARQLILEEILSAEGIPPEVYESFSPEQKAIIHQAVEERILTIRDRLEAQVEELLEQQMPTIKEEVESSPGAKQLSDLLNMLKGYDQLLAGLNQYISGVDEISSGVNNLSAGISKFHDGLLEYREGFSEYFYGMAVFNQESGKLVDGAYELKEGTAELLEGVIELKDGIVEFKDGVIELRDGVIELFDGIVELHDGVIEMYDGAIGLNDGVITLTDGIGELKDGTYELYDGVAELKDGTGEFRRETQSLDTKIIDAIKEEIDKMMGADIPVKSFVSEKNSGISAVQFVMQTQGISIPEKDADIIQPEPEVRLTFWQRLLRLFGF
mgnify:FL=1